MNRAGEVGSLGHIDSTQRDFRQQIDALNDAVRQLGGNPEIEGGGSTVNDPLSAPYVLYVDAYIGRDTFVSGDYASADDGTFEDKMRRISLQRLECGYTQSRPFRTISRAVIEAGIITSRDYLNIPGSICGDLVSIVVAPGIHTVINDPGADSVSTWANGFEPTDTELAEFNPPNVGGLILPRGCSVISLDLRKTILRPNYVPARDFEANDYSNRRAILKVTGGGYYFGFTFMDKVGATESHHLLSCFEYASESELDRFYAKIRTAFGPAAGVSDTNAVARSTEYQIVGPVNDFATVATDTVRSASPYIYNTSIRSTLGLCGIFADGSRVSGFKSMVVAQFTGVSLQNDLSCWQKYSGSNWSTVTNSSEFIDLGPDDIRMDPRQLSFHVRAIEEAVIQEVSVFAIGQGVHHWAESGAQLTVTNSNSNFGGVAGLATGYQSKVARDDGPWALDKFRTALSPLAKSGNIKRIVLGTTASNQSNTATRLNLNNDLSESVVVSGQPDVLAREGYSLKADDYIWVENPGGEDYRARLAVNPWSAGDANVIKVQTALETENGDTPGNPDNLNEFPDLAGKRVYVRRILDVRSVEERRYSVLASNVDGKKLRLPNRDYVIAIAGSTPDSRPAQAVAASETLLGQTSDIKVELRYCSKPLADIEFDVNTYYRKADVIVRNKKHYNALRNTTGAFKPEDWAESYVHMEESYNPEGFYTNAQPLIVFDKDTDGSEGSLLLGNSITDTEIVAQIETAVDRLGLQYFMQNQSYSKAEINNILSLATAENARDKVSKNEIVEFRRPTNIRLYSHAYEWAGYGNYSKALPQYQGEMSPSNKFTYYFTNENGGKVYATGFNEEGLQVSPRGLEDLTTGEVLNAVDVGSPDRDIDVPTEFEDLKANTSLELSFGDIGKMEDHALVRDTNSENNLSDFGVIKLAGTQDLSNTQAAANNADINSQPLAVTPLGLNYWKIQNNILSAPEGTVNIYVDPINGSDRPVDDLISLPPTQARYAVKTLMAAAEYVNQIYSPTTVAEYRCGPGIYYDRGRGFTSPVTFKTKAILRAWSFEERAYLNDSEFGGATPFFDQTVGGTAFDVDYFDDPSKQPTFLTMTRMTLDRSGTRPGLNISPLTLLFEEESSVTGFTWWGAAQTLANPLVADSFWDGFVDPADIAEVRTGITEGNALDRFIKVGLARLGQNDLYAIGGGSFKGACVLCEKEGTINNIAIGAMVPRPAGEVADDGQGMFQTRGDRLSIRGIWMIGNVQINSGFDYTFRGESTFSMHGYNEAMVYTDIRQRPNDGIVVDLGGNSPDADRTNFNQTWNNIHLINNNRAVATSTGTTGSIDTIGPALDAVFGRPASVDATADGAWGAGINSKPGDFQGFNGTFGYLKDFNSTKVNRTRGMFGYTADLGVVGASGGFKSSLKDFTLMRQAGSGAVPADSGYDSGPGSISAPIDFDALNVTVVAAKQGIDVSTAVIISRDCQL